MNDNNVMCPDCKSKDVQKLEEKRVMTEREGCLTHGFWKIVIGIVGVLCLIGALVGVVAGLGGDSGAIGGGVVFLLIGVVCMLVYFKNFKKKADAETLTLVHYACRSCGREFRGA